MGLSDSNESEEEQKEAFEDLFVNDMSCKLLKKAKAASKKMKDKTSTEQKKPIKYMCANEKYSSRITSGTKKPHDMSDSERESSSSPNLSDLEGRAEVSEQVIEMAEEEIGQETITNKAAEHDELAAWLEQTEKEQVDNVAQNKRIDEHLPVKNEQAPKIIQDDKKENQNVVN